MILNFLGRDSGFGEKNNSAYYVVDNRLVIIDCGFTVFNIVKNKFDFSKFESIEVVITHLHNDHAGSLSQLILYLWFIFHKKVTVISKCKKIQEYLDITGTTKEAYEIKSSSSEIEFIETTHVAELDAYGFIANINNSSILYTGDTSTLKPFEPYFSKISEFYVDVSCFGGVHLKIEDVFPKLKELRAKGIDIYLMHLDNKNAIKLITNGEFSL